MAGVLSDVQTAAKEILASDEYFARVPVIVEQRGDVTNAVQIAIGKLGLCVIVTTPEADCQATNAPGPILDPIVLACDVVELVIRNRGENGTQLPASDVAERVTWIMHGPNHAQRRTDPCLFLFKTLRLIPDKQFVVYRVLFHTTGALAGITSVV